MTWPFYEPPAARHADAPKNAARRQPRAHHQSSARREARSGRRGSPYRYETPGFSSRSPSPTKDYLRGQIGELQREKEELRLQSTSLRAALQKSQELLTFEATGAWPQPGDGGGYHHSNTYSSNNINASAESVGVRLSTPLGCRFFAPPEAHGVRTPPHALTAHSAIAARGGPESPPAGWHAASPNARWKHERRLSDLPASPPPPVVCGVPDERQPERRGYVQESGGLDEISRLLHPLLENRATLERELGDLNFEPPEGFTQRRRIEIAAMLSFVNDQIRRVQAGLGGGRAAAQPVLDPFFPENRVQHPHFAETGAQRASDSFFLENGAAQHPHFPENSAQHHPHFPENRVQPPHFAENSVQHPHFAENSAQHPHFAENSAQHPHFAENSAQHPHFAENSAQPAPDSFFPGSSAAQHPPRFAEESRAPRAFDPFLPENGAPPALSSAAAERRPQAPAAAAAAAGAVRTAGTTAAHPGPVLPPGGAAAGRHVAGGGAAFVQLTPRPDCGGPPDPKRAAAGGKQPRARPAAAVQLQPATRPTGSGSVPSASRGADDGSTRSGSEGSFPPHGAPAPPFPGAAAPAAWPHATELPQALRQKGSFPAETSPRYDDSSAPPVPAQYAQPRAEVVPEAMWQRGSFSAESRRRSDDSTSGPTLMPQYAPPHAAGLPEALRQRDSFSAESSRRHDGSTASGPPPIPQPSHPRGGTPAALRHAATATAPLAVRDAEAQTATAPAQPANGVLAPPPPPKAAAGGGGAGGASHEPPAVLELQRHVADLTAKCAALAEQLEDQQRAGRGGARAAGKKESADPRRAPFQQETHLDARRAPFQQETHLDARRAPFQQETQLDARRVQSRHEGGSSLAASSSSSSSAAGARVSSRLSATKWPSHPHPQAPLDNRAELPGENPVELADGERARRGSGSSRRRPDGGERLPSFELPEDTESRQAAMQRVRAIREFEQRSLLSSDEAMRSVTPGDLSRSSSPELDDGMLPTVRYEVSYSLDTYRPTLSGKPSSSYPASRQNTRLSPAAESLPYPHTLSTDMVLPPAAVEADRRDSSTAATLSSASGHSLSARNRRGSDGGAARSRDSNSSGSQEKVKLGFVGEQWPCRPGKAAPAVVIAHSRDKPIIASAGELLDKLGVDRLDMLAFFRNTVRLPEIAPGGEIDLYATPAELGFKNQGVIVVKEL
ncbi:hypothetical protein DIPPA_11282 [Diplonema papillatum]|nr:hypothetical protein DIPPA_11282 [Diplonema papillatum]